ncbi:MAG: TlpA family protein disulfide reductase [Gemmatimonadaceae bacterium]|nr:TlpA family protein disulfide reductase [Chitinophagaceae bacterium]
MMRSFLLWTVFCISGYQSLCQKDLDIGDKLPEKVYDLLEAGSKTPGKMSSYKGQSLVVNFWSNYCGTCIESMPEEERLQKMFGDSIKLVLVTSNTQREVDDLFKKRKLKFPELRCITGDSLLKTFFPYSSVPYLIWINASGIVAHITYGNKFIEENIRDFVLGKKLDMGNEKSEFLNFNYDIHLVQNDGVPKRLRYFSVLTDELKGVGSLTGRKYDSTGAGFRVANGRLIDLYRYAYGGFPKCKFEYDASVCLQVSDSAALLKQYSYELKLPIGKKEEWQHYMQADLDKYFDFDIKIIPTSEGKEMLVISETTKK